jgi:[ribosomal protein S5]-alanine N-acetyltransferase
LSKSPTPTLASARFVLRPLTREDAPALFPTFADPEAMRYWSRGPFESEAELGAWLAPQKGWDAGRSWAVAESLDGPALGRLVAIDKGDHVSEIGYIIVRERQGQGIAREATAVLIDHLFSAEKLRRIYADTDPDNTGSIALVKSLGFTLEGRLREHWVTHIGRRDSLIWGLLDHEWQARRQLS